MHNTKYLPLPYPDCYFAITREGGGVKRYFLDSFDDSTFMKKRVYQYLGYHKKRYWQDHTDKPFPEIILVCPNEKIQSILYRFIKKKITTDTPSFYVSSAQIIQKQRIQRQVLQKVV